MNRETFSANHRCPKRRHGVRILRDYEQGKPGACLCDGIETTDKKKGSSCIEFD